MNKQTLPKTIHQPSGMAIEAVLWQVFAVEGAGRVVRQADRIGGPRGMRSALGGLGQLEALGARVDTSGAAVVTLSDLAEVVLGLVEALPPEAAALVIRHAEAGTRPALPEGDVRLVPVLSQHGKPLVVYGDPYRRKQPLWCPVEQDPLPEHVEFLRASWVLWWDAVEWLAGQCGAKPLACQREPWATADNGVDSGAKV